MNGVIFLIIAIIVFFFYTMYKKGHEIMKFQDFVEKNFCWKCVYYEELENDLKYCNWRKDYLDKYIFRNNECMGFKEKKE